MGQLETFDAVVVGGGPAGATAAHDLANTGRSVLLLDRAGRIKPCGGAVPPRLIEEFEIPSHLIVARVGGARIFSPKSRRVEMPIEGNGYVGMVDRDVFDEWLRERARLAGARRVEGTFDSLSRDADGFSIVTYRQKTSTGEEEKRSVRARSIVGADGALSAVARQAIPGAGRVPYVFAYHEIVRIPPGAQSGNPSSMPRDYDGRRCDIYYQGSLSPDFYAWIFPHGETASIGTGSAHKGFSLRSAVGALRASTGLGETETIRREGAPIPLRPLKKWDNGRDIVLAGDAAGVVAPASGEGIFYAMTGGRLAADAVEQFLTTGEARSLASARRNFMRDHGRVFWVLSIMQRFWYSSEGRRERFVKMCGDPDVQRLTWESYMHKKLVRKDPMAHVRIFFKDMAHLLGLVAP
ncbi:geranylgeranyl diphosphate reductase [Hyphomicrobium sp. ghe19]|uniref:geranylgeranyl diphosphate reductase n=1 Tax=Hyphomicrobium sp. ghe19 TaxID=2682968 RepID=UPI0013674DA8|nr:Kynurenine 3-monooxygenase [Hyphomicrobium sp. ghe19]